jgi:hypothetical protein
MRSFLFLFIFSICIQKIGFAQIETVQRNIKIKAAEIASEEVTSKYPITVSPIQGLTNKDIKISMNIKPIDGFAKKSYGITEKPNLETPSWDVKQQFSESKKDVSKYSRDYYLGDIRSTTKYIKIVCRDHEYEDGDRIRLTLNKIVIHPNLMLRNSPYSIEVKLQDGLNSIDFIALNEGDSSPNTAQLKVYDDNGQLIGSGEWLLRTNYKAKLIVLKD